MKKIRELAERIQEELNDAQYYIEECIESRVMGETSIASKYKEMASDELKHAGYLHDMVVEEIKKAQGAGVTPPASMMEKWNTEHKLYIEKVAWLKQMLNL